jgi:hypothetical protein
MINELSGDRTDMRSQLWEDGRTADRRVRWTATWSNKNFQGAQATFENYLSSKFSMLSLPIGKGLLVVDW